jgi:hypothetical protein
VRKGDIFAFFLKLLEKSLDFSPFVTMLAKCVCVFSSFLVQFTEMFLKIIGQWWIFSNAFSTSFGTFCDFNL